MKKEIEAARERVEQARKAWDDARRAIATADEEMEMWRVERASAVEVVRAKEELKKLLEEEMEEQK
jgi:hypothetical protein